MDALLEEYIDNRNHWLVGDIDGSIFTIEGGTAVFKTRNKYIQNVIYIPISQLYNRNLTIKASMRCLSIPRDGIFGLVWGFQNINNLFELVIPSSGEYAISYKIEDGFFTPLHPTEKLTSHIKVKEYHVYEVHITNNSFSICIDSEPLLEIKNPNLRIIGDKVGYMAGSNTKLEISRLFVGSGNETNITNRTNSLIDRQNHGLDIKEENPKISNSYLKKSEQFTSEKNVKNIIINYQNGYFYNEYALSMIDEKSGNTNVPTRVMVKMASDEDNWRRRNVLINIMFDVVYGDGFMNSINKARFVDINSYPLVGLIDLIYGIDAFHSMVGCNIINKQSGKLLFNFTYENGLPVLDMPWNTFVKCWKLLEIDVMEEIHKKILVMNPQWDISESHNKPITEFIKELTNT